MKLWAISDLHLGIDLNRRAVERVASRPEDWLILAGDIGDSAADLALAFDILAPRFDKLIWVPGNHELWTEPRTPDALVSQSIVTTLPADQMTLRTVVSRGR